MRSYNKKTKCQQAIKQQQKNFVYYQIERKLIWQPLHELLAELSLWVQLSTFLIFRILFSTLHGLNDLRGLSTDPVFIVVNSIELLCFNRFF